jgi:hypothetical protein
VADLDAARDAKRRPGHPARGRPRRRCGCRRLPASGRSRPQLTPAMWKPRFVGADDEIRHRRDAAVGDHADRFLRCDRAEEARFGAEVVEDLGFGREAVIGQAGQFRELDLVDDVVAAHQRQHETLVGRHDRDRLDRACQRDAQQRGHVLAGLLRRRVDRLRSDSVAAARGAGRQRFGHLDVRGVIRTRREGDRVFAGIGQHVEFMRGAAADGAGVGIHGAELQAEAGEDARVGAYMFSYSRAMHSGVMWNE